MAARLCEICMASAGRFCAACCRRLCPWHMTKGSCPNAPGGHVEHTAACRKQFCNLCEEEKQS